jgi:hypothetical protein
MPTAKFLTANHAKKEEQFVKRGSGFESGGIRTSEGHIPIADLVYRYLDTVGDGSGTKSATGNYSSGATFFRINVPHNYFYSISTLIVHVEDASALGSDDYGNISNGLTNGILIGVYDASNNLVVCLCDGVAIKANSDFNKVAYDVVIDSYTVEADHVLNAQYDFRKSGSALFLPAEYSLRVRLNDDLSGLVEHTFFVTGHRQLSSEVN